MNSIASSLEGFGKSISSGIGSASDFCVESYESFKSQITSYFKSNEYEDDLDSIIKALYSHTNKMPDFKFSDDYKERVRQKRDFLTGQAAKLVLAGALSGTWAAIKSGNFVNIGEYTIVGAGGAVLIVVVTVAGIVVKRVLNGAEMSYSKTSKEVKVFSSNF
ncbi:MAG: hypothetical protein HOE90_00195 [Bacteriovoracaceae bacterium]|jgi:hypothetical protein|nr:hypothetical protein [Bacteriovoracaceae bacterium]